MMKTDREMEKAKHVLTDERLAAIKAMLEKDHAIDCLLLLHMNRGKWKEAKDFMRENKLTLSDGTFRARMIEIVEIIDAWLAPDHRYFKVRGDNGACYILRHDVPAARWELTMYDRTGAAG